MFIYEIVNTKNNKRYIGLSTCKYRWSQHKSLLRRNKHKNIHLQAAWNKYKESAFIFNILEYTINLEVQEKYWINKYKSNLNEYGYNKTQGGEIKKQISEETRQKMRNSQKKRFQNPEQRKKCATRTGIAPANKGIKTGKPSWQTGKPISIEAKLKMQKTKKLNPYKASEETRKKLSQALKGKRLGKPTGPLSTLSYASFCKKRGFHIIQVYKNNILLSEWPSIKSCARALAIDSRGITRNLTNKTKSFKDYTFKYKLE